MHSKALYSALLLGAAVALPTTTSSDWSSPSGSWSGQPGAGQSGGGQPGGYKPLIVDANFDDLTATAADLTPVGIYKYLNYVGLSVGSEYIAGVQIFGVKPHSPPNVAYSDAISSLFAGPSLQAEYSGSKTKAFDLESFYYACVDATETVASTAENCTITVTGYRQDEQVATQNFTYTQDNVLAGDLDATMTFGKLNKDFSFLTEVNITYVMANTVDSPAAFIGDDFVYAVYLEDWNEGANSGDYSS